MQGGFCSSRVKSATNGKELSHARRQPLINCSITEASTATDATACAKLTPKGVEAAFDEVGGSTGLSAIEH
jgi:hypothetical protein